MKKNELTQEIVRELLDYDPETGLLFWKEREAKWFSKENKRKPESVKNNWNSKFAGKEALSSTNSNGYRTGYILGSWVQAHRIIFLYMTGSIPEEVDHENGITNDNRWENLKKSNRFSNMKNVSSLKNNTSGRKGVFKIKDNRWRSIISIRKKRIHLGYFKTFEEAVASRKEAEIKYNFTNRHGN